MPKRTKAPVYPKWTPPIFGWQYPIIWVSAEECFTWDHQDWPSNYPYRLWVTGRSMGTGRLMWSIYLMLPGLDHVRIIAQSEKSLEAAARALERQVLAMLRGLRQIQDDRGKKTTI